MRYALPLAALLTGCCADPWAKFPSTVAPDRSYSVGGSVAGDDVYVWNCVDGHHLVVHQYSSEMTCSAAVREVADCGVLTTFEQRTAGKTMAPARGGRQWR